MIVSALLLIGFLALAVGIWGKRANRGNVYSSGMTVFAVAVIAFVLDLMIAAHTPGYLDSQPELVGQSEPYTGVLYFGRHYRLNVKALNVPCTGKRYDVEAIVDKTLSQENVILKKDHGDFLHPFDTFLVVGTSEVPEPVVEIKPAKSTVACWVTRGDLMAMIVTATPEPNR